MSPLFWLCNAFFLVYYVAFVVSYKNCGSPNSCTGLFLNDPDYTSASGYKSAIGPNTSHSGGQMICTGSHSCKSMQFIESISGSIFCDGVNSCSNVIRYIQTNRSLPTRIYCRASGACAATNIITKDLRCSGHKSCANAHIYSASIVEASGSFSLFESTIDSNNSITSALTVRLRGRFAGYGATLICRVNHTCTVECLGIDACAMLYVDCQGECTYYIDDTSVPPTTNLTAFMHRNTDINIYKLFDSEIIEPNTDIFCVNDSFAFDTDGERYSGSAVNITVDGDYEGPICCRGADACQSVDRIGYQMPTKGGNDVICSGSQSCRRAHIMRINETYCEASESCRLSSIAYVSNLYCDGFAACADANITNAQNIVCRGQTGCQGATVISGGSDLNIYFSGEVAGQHTTVYCDESDTCTIQCLGENSCLSTTVYCNGNCIIQCDAAYVSTCPIVHSVIPTIDPSTNPTLDTANPSQIPSVIPSSDPSFNPTINPSHTPSVIPSIDPSANPTINPSQTPSVIPSIDPTYPSINPTLNTINPSQTPSAIPSKSPTNIPMQLPTQYLLSTVTETTKWIEPTTKWIAPTTKDNTAVIVVICVILVLILAFGTAIWRLLKQKKNTLQVATGNMAIDPGNTNTTTTGDTKRDTMSFSEKKVEAEANTVTVEMIETQTVAMPMDETEECIEDMYINKSVDQTDHVTATADAENDVIPQHVYAEQVYAEELCATTKGSKVTTAMGNTTRGNARDRGETVADGEDTDEEEGEINEVKEWLDKKVEMMEYYVCFVNNGLTSLALIKNIKEISDLQNIGIGKIEHQYAIMHHIKQLKK
eukprot:181012_1